MTQAHPVRTDPLSPARTAEARCPVFHRTSRLGNAAMRGEFEFNSRGARVMGDLFYGDKPAERLVVIGHAAGASADPELDALSETWAARGALVARIDLPLHGRRANPKLTPRLLETLEAGYRRSSLEDRLWWDFADQTMADFQGVLEVLPGPVEARLTGACFVGFGLGAACGARFCAASDAVSRAVLIGLGRDTLPGGVDPLPALSALPPQKLLLAWDDRDRTLPAESAQALRDTLRAVATHSYSGPAPPQDFVETVWKFLSG